MKTLMKKLLDGNTMVQVPPNPEVHKIHRHYTRELLKIKKQARIIENEAKRISKKIDTTTRIAIATGALKNYER